MTFNLDNFNPLCQCKNPSANEILNWQLAMCNIYIYIYIFTFRLQLLCSHAALETLNAFKRSSKDVITHHFEMQQKKRTAKCCPLMQKRKSNCGINTISYHAMRHSADTSEQQFLGPLGEVADGFLEVGDGFDGALVHGVCALLRVQVQAVVPVVQLAAKGPV